jgi:hypothetical protein
LASCWILVLCAAVFALDIWLSMPRVPPLLPFALVVALLFAPLGAAVVALAFTVAAAARREPDALRAKTWFGAALIAGFYAFSAVWLYFHPLVDY